MKARNYSICREILNHWLLKVLPFSGFRKLAEDSRLASVRSRVSMSNRSLKKLRCGWSLSEFLGIIGTDPVGASDLGEDFISLLAANFNGKP
jgi:hypothetical protein